MVLPPVEQGLPLRAGRVCSCGAADDEERRDRVERISQIGVVPVLLGRLVADDESLLRIVSVDPTG